MTMFTLTTHRLTLRNGLDTVTPHSGQTTGYLIVSSQNIHFGHMKINVEDMASPAIFMFNEVSFGHFQPWSCAIKHAGIQAQGQMDAYRDRVRFLRVQWPQPHKSMNTNILTAILVIIVNCQDKNLDLTHAAFIPPADRLTKWICPRWLPHLIMEINTVFSRSYMHLRL